MDPALGSAEQPGQVSAGNPADRKALRRLVPYDRIEFIASDDR